MIKLYSQIAEPIAEGVDGLKSALQTAVELEHATLPPYLYALYSIRPGTNQRLSKIILSIVLEEMLHLALACNLLNAIGGQPSLNHPEFIPSYPGPLPGVSGAIDVPLAPVSKKLIHDVFMEIEKPETPLSYPVKKLFELKLTKPRTIGLFYQAIKEQLVASSAQENIFVGKPSRQLGVGLPGLKKVTDLASAIAAIELIVEQGEGTSSTPLNALEKPAHYYMFAAAYYGRELVPQQGEPPFAYAGEEIPFDEDNIKPLMVNPKPASYLGTPAMDANQQFNRTYTSLLQTLHKTFNGSPMSIMGSVGIMQQLKAEAIALGEIQIGQNLFAGPTFTYTPA
ncbi:hypothetical protein ABIE26_001616 [Pedobacter africanus]|uniref:Uncharacterized protein n=1 Tax=Pedobacter africanus TaxID=151894 RepID=A0ACC6KRT3_9SPHI|nr:ferritin-like protein [Pedobacter africanus]MDR6781895.1 hypothetical protein [Pedobacter africanus]